MTVDWIEVRDGKVFWRGVYLTPRDCDLRLAEFTRKLPAGDWFAPHQRAIADSLRAAMAEAEAYYILEDA